MAPCVIACVLMTALALPGHAAQMAAKSGGNSGGSSSAAAAPASPSSGGSSAASSAQGASKSGGSAKKGKSFSLVQLAPDSKIVTRLNEAKSATAATAAVEDEYKAYADDDEEEEKEPFPRKFWVSAWHVDFVGGTDVDDDRFYSTFTFHFQVNSGVDKELSTTRVRAIFYCKEIDQTYGTLATWVAEPNETTPWYSEPITQNHIADFYTGESLMKENSYLTWEVYLLDADTLEVLATDLDPWGDMIKIDANENAEETDEPLKPTSLNSREESGLAERALADPEMDNGSGAAPPDDDDDNGDGGDGY